MQTTSAQADISIVVAVAVAVAEEEDATKIDVVTVVEATIEDKVEERMNSNVVNTIMERIYRECPEN